MKRLLITPLLIIIILLVTTTSAPAAERPIAVTRDFGTLHGTLRTPDNGAQTVALLIAGSGPTDRNGNSAMGVNTNNLLYLAQALEKAGIASLRYDKRGVAASYFDDPEKMGQVVLDDFIGDAVALADHLVGEGFERIVLIGHSEGALIASVTAQRTGNAAAVVCVSGAGYPMDEVLSLQLANQLAPAHMDLLMKANEAIATLKRGERVEEYPRELAALFNPAVQPFLISCMRFDPCAELREVNVPVLIVSGDNDIQVTVDNAEALAGAKPDAQLAIIAGMTHVLKKAEGRTLAEQAQTVYVNGSLPLDEELVSAIVRFVEKL